MIRPAMVCVLFGCLASPAAAQGFTVINDRGGKVERNYSVANGQLNRSVARTTAGGQTMGREIELRKTGPGQAVRTVTGTGPNGNSHTRRATITRN